MSNIVAKKVPFFDLTELLERIYLSHVTKHKKLILMKFIDSWNKYHSMLHKGDGSKTLDSFYPAMRLILPECERERVAYGIKETNLAHLYIKTLSLSKDGEDSLKLLNFKQENGTDHAIKHYQEDFADIAYNVLKNRCPEFGKLSIHDVNHHLDNIAINKATKNKEMVTKNMLQLIQNTSALEQKWLIRIILKKLSIGLGQNTILSIFHPDAVALFNVTNDLEKVCLTLRDPKVRATKIEIQPFTPFKPMLSERSSHRLILDLIEKKGEPFYIETKFDGERMQLHFKNGQFFRYFSRRGYDYTASFGPSRTEGIYTPSIVDCFGMDVTSCILDGEMVGYHKLTNTIGHKGPFFDIKYINEDSEYQPCYCAFDLLYLNGKLLTSIPLSQRKDLLQKKFKPLLGTFMVVEWWKASKEEDILKSLDLAIESREEGIMVKDPESLYIPNERKAGWFKVKPDYVEGLMDSLDLLLVGAYYGRSKKKRKARHHKRPPKERPDGGLLTHFLVAGMIPNRSRDKFDQPADGESRASNEDGPHFLPLCVIGSGFSNKELYQLLTTLQSRFKPYHGNVIELPQKSNGPKMCKNLPRHAPKLDTYPSAFENILFPERGFRPDVWIPPSQSVILQIKASRIKVYRGPVGEGECKRIDGLEESLIGLKDDEESSVGSVDAVLGTDEKVETGSTTPPSTKDFDGTCTHSLIDTFVSLKFPRLERVRYDKSWDECMTIDELVDLDYVVSKKYQMNMNDKFKPLQLVSRAYSASASGNDSPDKVKGRKIVRTLVSHAKPLNLTNTPINLKSHTFDGLEFCIISGNDTMDKREMERQCIERGAKIVQNPGPHTTYIVSGNMNAKVNNFIASQKYDIIKASWLNACIRNEKCLPCKPLDMIYATPERTVEFKGRYDEYGDSYYDDISGPELRTIMDNMDVDGTDFITPNQILEIRREMEEIS